MDENCATFIGLKLKLFCFLFKTPSLTSTKMNRSNGGVTHRSPLRIDVTSSSEDASHNNDEETSPYSLTDSAMGGSAMSPEPLDESHEINGSASAHDKSHCRYI